MPRIKTINELQRELEMKRRRLEKLQSRRDSLTGKLEKVDSDIARLVGGGKPGRPPKKQAARRGRPPKAAKIAKPRPTRTRASGKPLNEYMREILAKAPKGMRVKELAAAVESAGYRSASKDFYGIVAKTLLEDRRFKRLSRGVYTLA